ncbi:hypothetical protein SADUNF_Sadunf06G0191700 [Salix dunnii]|uniref:RING-type E3 ubiquitin transferase n=1 Tax=Salix dunnii TaxID=1413687 RepID=A0A835N395_9ROSI|nr:hypothetical protein SADUNF_Sadunf06G0191700 [Salix dunnii]
MNRLLLIIILTFFFFHVEAQITSHSDPGLKPVHQGLPLILGIVSTMLFITFFVLAYAKFCGGNQNNFLGLFNLHRQNLHGLIRSSSRFSGIDEEVIKSLPFFRFSSLKGSKEGLECAVCISTFEDSEVLRLLPKCKHAFHDYCIDEWLKSHSSCPLCRYKLDPKDPKSFTYSRSWRHLQNPSNLAEDPNLEIFVEREHDRQVSTCFNPGSSFQISNDSSKKEEFLVEAGSNADDRNRKLFHKFMHKIIISDVLIKNRWSDANSSDFLSLSTEMLRDMSSDRFSPQKSSSARFHNGLSRVENLENAVKDDTERKTLFEPQLTTVDRSNSVPSSGLKSSKMPNPAWKRSVSEVTIFSRFRQLSVRNKMKESTSLGKDERIKTLWLPLARRTIHWFTGRERNSRQLEYERQASNV